MPISKTVTTLLDWAERPLATAFPFDVALAGMRLHGKHFANAELLAALAQARARFLQAAGDRRSFLGIFLDIALDKHDGTFDYDTYVALPLLEHALPERAGTVTAQAEQRALDGVTCSLVGDAMRFELRALRGEGGYLAGARPSVELVERRLGFALRSIAGALGRLGFEPASGDDGVMPRATCVVEFCSRLASGHSRLVLEASMLPAYTLHDEYMFIRVVQIVDAAFRTIAQLLQAALACFDAALAEARDLVVAAASMLGEALAQFHTLSTMQRDAFATFRVFTSGASAVQSGHYRLMESLCSRPDAERLDSIAYAAMPALQETLRRGGPSLDDKLRVLRAGPMADTAIAREITAAFASLGETLTRWRHSHYGMAKKYLGEGTGTGYTEGTPYLKAVKDLPVFPALCDVVPPRVG